MSRIYLIIIFLRGVGGFFFFWGGGVVLYLYL